MWLVLTPALLVSVALLGCSGDKDKKRGGGDGKKDGNGKKDDGKDGDQDGKLEPVKVGGGTISGTITLKKGVEPDYEELKAELKKKIDKNTNRNACKEAYEQKAWLVDKSSRGVKNVAVWLMPENDSQFFDAKELAEKKKGKAFDPVVVLDQPHCNFEPRVVVLFPAYIDPSKPKTEDGDPNYVPTGQKFYAVNPVAIKHNTKLIVPRGGGKSDGRVVPESTKANPEKGLDLTAISDLHPYDLSKGPIHIACDIHDWMSGSAWARPHPLAAVTDDKGKFEIKNVPDTGKVRIFVWHEGAGFITPKNGKVIDAKDGKQDFTIEDVK